MLQEELLIAMANVFAYRVEHDRGLAPNPFFGVCSLAVCKPRIRAKARCGDYIIGTSSYDQWKVPRSGVTGGGAVFIMRVTAITDFDHYYRDYPSKRPNMRGSRLRRGGDAIYHRDPATGDWIQDDSLHSHPGGSLSAGDLATDTGSTENILLSNDFTYWGKQAPALPVRLSMFTRKEVREQHDFDPQDKAAFMAWADARLGQGRVGEPIDWHK